LASWHDVVSGFTNWKQRAVATLNDDVGVSAGAKLADAGAFGVIPEWDYEGLDRQAARHDACLHQLFIAAKNTEPGRDSSNRASQGSSPTKAESIDIVIVTIREDENRAVFSRIQDRQTVPRKNRTYSIGAVANKSGRRFTVAVVRTPEQGQNAANDTTRDAIEDLDPAWIMVVGIAGAVPDNEFTLGDVVVASRLHDFTVGALLPDAPPEFTNQGGSMVKEVQDLIGILPALETDLAGWNTEEQLKAARPAVDLSDENFYGDDHWQAKTRSSLQEHFCKLPVRKDPLFTTRAIASSGYLIKNTEIVKNWSHGARDLMAVEMELAGVYSASRRRGKDYPVVAVRGISDIVGFKRSPAWTTYACNTAGSFCVSLLANLPPNFVRSSKQG
jgi:nucleoside phosphorylase